MRGMSWPTRLGVMAAIAASIWAFVVIVLTFVGHPAATNSRSGPSASVTPTTACFAQAHNANGQTVVLYAANFNGGSSFSCLRPLGSRGLFETTGETATATGRVHSYASARIGCEWRGVALPSCTAGSNLPLPLVTTRTASGKITTNLPGEAVTFAYSTASIPSGDRYDVVLDDWYGISAGLQRPTTELMVVLAAHGNVLAPASPKDRHVVIGGVAYTVKFPPSSGAKFIQFVRDQPTTALTNFEMAGLENYAVQADYLPRTASLWQWSAGIEGVKGGAGFVALKFSARV